MTDETRVEQWEREHERALDYDLERHSDTCYLTGCIDCREERMLRGLDVPPLRVPDYIAERQASFDDEDYRIGEAEWESHWFHFARIERVSESYL